MTYDNKHIPQSTIFLIGNAEMSLNVYFSLVNIMTKSIEGDMIENQISKEMTLYSKNFQGK